MVDFETHPLKKGDLVFVGSGQCQEFNKKKNFDAQLILFTEDFLFREAALSNSMLLNLLYPLAGMPPVIRADRRIYNSITMLGEEWSEPDEFERASILRTLLDYLLLQVCRARNVEIGRLHFRIKCNSSRAFFD